MKVTQWFCRKSPPMREGLYECRWAWGDMDYFLWEGGEWLTAEGESCGFGWSGDQWRGLAEKP